ncbi:hypothetical protein [Agrococcus lahaulensis]|uniref:hypothetical protein n=1 Tax=Agrococcus lahaulensis TaxID=341722 RepID=UPI00054ED863|nr:hypothetical protein [Agrococcus lahaulensis]
MAQRIWIVQHDESPDNTVLGVFDDETAADRFAKEVQDRWTNGVLIASHEIGYRYDAGSYRFGP